MNKNVEIERKFKILSKPENINDVDFVNIEQAYLCTAPVVRIRKQNDEYILTYKNGNGIAHTEYNLPLSKEGYEHLLKKADGNVITKTRYMIPLEDGLMAELDIFEGVFEGLEFVEVEFDSIEQAKNFKKPDWFGEDVTNDKRYHNSYLSKLNECK